jgi:uncharacterized protein YndB with AHSA1/START domain
MENISEKTMENMDENRNELIITRVFNVPRQLVWRAWTDPEIIKHWWGAITFKTTHFEIDFRIGGCMLYNMRSPDGQVIWGTGKYREIVPFERLVVTDSFADEKGNIVSASYYGMGEGFPLELLVTVTLENLGEKTKLTLKHTGLPAGKMLEYTKEGWNQSFEKLTDLLHKQLEDEKKEGVFKIEPVGTEVIITEVFDAPREAVFRAYIDADLIPQWWGPKEFTTEVDKLEVKPGGVWRYIQCGPDGNEYGFHGEFREIDQPDCLVYTFEYEGLPGHQSIESISLEEKDGKTIVHDQISFQNIEDRDGMLRTGLEEGSRESRIRLAELLTKI